MMLCKAMISFLKDVSKHINIYFLAYNVEAILECCILLISDSNVQRLEIFNENGHLCRLKTLKGRI